MRTALLRRSVAGLAFLAACASSHRAPDALFDVRAYGASGRRADDARPALQAAIDACAAAGGGTVLVPPGEYTSGSLELRSHVRVLIAGGATVYSAKGKASFPTEALFHGQDLEGVTLEGRGTLDGQAEYEWRENDIEDMYIRPNQLRMEAAGKSLRRSFPTKDSVGHLVRLVRCGDVLIRDLSLRRSPSWNIHLWGCERVRLEGLDIRSSLTEGVWADGIDPDGCKDVRVSDCTIETGDDALVFYSTKLFGPARPCEDITVTNCRLTSSSSAIKFCDGNENCVRRVTIDNCAITNSNRGVAFMVFDGGYVSDVVLSNLTIECTRRDWFWWGEGDPIHFNAKQRSDIDPRVKKPDEPPPGAIRNVRIQNVIARGTGTCSLEGHPRSPLEHVTIDGLDLHLAADPRAPYETLGDALALRHARDVELRGVTVFWDEPPSARAGRALVAEDVQDLRLEGFAARASPAASAAPAVALTDVAGALLRGCRALPGTGEFLRVGGASRDVQLVANDLRAAATPWAVDADLGDVVSSSGDLLSKP